MVPTDDLLPVRLVATLLPLVTDLSPEDAEARPLRGLLLAMLLELLDVPYPVLTVLLVRLSKLLTTTTLLYPYTGGQ